MSFYGKNNLDTGIYKELVALLIPATDKALWLCLLINSIIFITGAYSVSQIMVM